MQNTSKINMMEYDMNTISAGDFTCELDLTNEMYDDFLDNFYEPFGSRQTDDSGKIYSPALYLKKHLMDEISRILSNQMKNRIKSGVNNKGKKGHRTMVDGLPRIESVQVKDIQFAYNNY